MITVIHGDDTVSSRRNFIDQKQKTSSSIVFDAKSLTMTDVIQVFEGAGLFGDEKKIFIENFFSSIQSAEVVSYIKKNTTHEVFLWEGRQLTKTNLSIFPHAKVLTFKLPQTLFSFLDNIKPDHGQNLIKLFHTLLQNTEVELVFYMLVRQIRVFIALSSQDTKENIDEVKRLAPWQKERLTRQARFFSLDKLKGIYQQLYDIDLSQKTGNTALTLVQAVDFFLLGI